MQELHPVIHRALGLGLSQVELRDHTDLTYDDIQAYASMLEEDFPHCGPKHQEIVIHNGTEKHSAALSLESVNNGYEHGYAG